MRLATDIIAVTANSATAVEIIPASDTTVVSGWIVSVNTAGNEAAQIVDADGNVLFHIKTGANTTMSAFSEPFLVTNGLSFKVQAGAATWRCVIFHGGPGS